MEQENFRVLYHVTKKSNVDSIMKKGLIPNIGRNRKRCHVKSERTCKDKWISFCDEKGLDKWMKSLYKGKDTVALKVTVPMSLGGFKHRKWAEGYEYGYFGGRISPDWIEPMED